MSTGWIRIITIRTNQPANFARITLPRVVATNAAAASIVGSASMVIKRAGLAVASSPIVETATDAVILNNSSTVITLYAASGTPGCAC